MTFAEFAAARLPALLRYAAILSGDTDLAQDIVQDVLVRTQLRWRRIDRVESPDAYVRRMVLNEYLSWRRRWAVRNIRAMGDQVDALADARAVTRDHSEAVADADDVWGRLARLPRKQRAVLVLRHYEQLDDAEIGNLLECSPATVRSHASKALATLRLQAKESITVSGGVR